MGDASGPSLDAPAAQRASPAADINASEHCVTDRPLNAEEAATGELSTLGGIDVYISKPNDYPHAPCKLLLFLTNGTGIKSLNNQVQADKFAHEGFLVVMPDMFAGDAAPNSTHMVPPASDDEHPTLIEQVKLHVAETAKAFRLDMWLARHTPEKVMPRLHKVIESMKAEFADALASGGGLYAVGYCFGGKYVLLLGQAHKRTSSGAQLAEDHEAEATEESPVIKAGALAHGTLVTLDDIKSVKAPVSMVCTENDQLFPDEVREEGKSALKDHGVEHEITVYPNVPHGFAVAGEYPEKHIKRAQETAFEQMLHWLKSH